MGALLGVAQGSVREARLLDPQVERRRRRRAAGRLRRQGRDLRHRRHLDQAGRRHGSDEMGHGRRWRGRRRDEGARAAQGQGQHRRHLRPGREHARRQCPAPGRRRDHHVGPDGRSDQHRCRRPARARRRDHLRAAQLQAVDDHRPRDPDRRDPDQPRPRMGRPVLEQRRACRQAAAGRRGDRATNCGACRWASRSTG